MDPFGAGGGCEQGRLFIGGEQYNWRSAEEYILNIIIINPRMPKEPVRILIIRSNA